MCLKSKIAELRIKEQEAVDRANNIEHPFNEKIYELQKQIEDLETKRMNAAYEAYGDIQSIRRKIWETYEQDRDEKYKEALNERKKKKGFFSSKHKE